MKELAPSSHASSRFWSAIHQKNQSLTGRSEDVKEGKLEVDKVRRLLVGDIRVNGNEVASQRTTRSTCFNIPYPDEVPNIFCVHSTSQMLAHSSHAPDVVWMPFRSSLVSGFQKTCSTPRPSTTLANGSFGSDCWAS